jgi:dUTP pyrophosphatase
MSMIHVKIINRSNNALPEYATADSSGMDIRADLHEAVTIKPLERVLIPHRFIYRTAPWL